MPEVFMPVTGVDLGLLSAVFGLLVAVFLAHLSLVRK